jgi:hypothetical protein
MPTKLPFFHNILKLSHMVVLFLNLEYPSGDESLREAVCRAAKKTGEKHFPSSPVIFTDS